MNEVGPKIIPVVLAGGVGSRLWPLSRAAHPKQFLSLNGDFTMLQQTLLRLSDLHVQKPVTICNEQHRFFVAEQLREIDRQGSIILEPFGRNTAPAVALAALLEECKDALLLVLAADHIITDEGAFKTALECAIPLAQEGRLVTFGVIPDGANTGYGYIEAGTPCGDGLKVKSFKEKPDLVTAQRYIDSGNYYWNSGMFFMRADKYLSEIESYRPDIYRICSDAVMSSKQDLDFIRIDTEIFAQCPEDSIDYAVMEKTSNSVVVPLNAGWTDVGSWAALWDVGPKDGDLNVIQGDVILDDTRGSYVRADHGLVAIIGVEDLVVVSTKDALLIAHKDKVQDVKKVVTKLKHQSRTEWENHREVYRPWGKFDSVDEGSRYQVKRITVKPGQKLSVQMHHHRSEHWVVVSGTASVRKGTEELLLTENESVYLPVGCLHSLENRGKIELELIEVQSGPYLGEDDIIRFEDNYGRA